MGGGRPGKTVVRTLPERSVEQVEDQLREDPVDREHERRQDRDRDEDDDRVGDELLAGRPVDLLELETDLTKELANAGALALLLLRRTAGRMGGAARRSTPDPFWRRSAFSCARFICRFMLLPLQARRDSNPQPPVLETGALPD